MLTTIEKVLILQDVEPFGLVSTECVAEIAMRCREVVFPAQHVLFRNGDPPLQLYILVEGAVQINGENSRVEHSVLGLWALCAELPYRESVRTLEQSKALVLTAEDFEELLSSETELCRAVLKYLARSGAESR